MIIVVATGLLGIFLPIFLFTFFHQSLNAVMMYYGVSSFLYALMLAFGGMWINRFGIQRSLRLSTIFGVLYYGIFYFLHPGNAVLLLTLSLGALTFYRILYWIPYHIDFAKFSSRVQRGRELSLLSVTENVIGIAIPVVGGFLITRFGFDALFVIAILFYGVSLFPFLLLPKTTEAFSWSYRETWQQLFAPARRRTIFAFMADGAESIVDTVVWPIFLFKLLQGNYLQVGALSTLIVASTIIAQLIVGKSVDRLAGNDERLLRAGSILYAVGWLFKVFIATAFQVFIVGTYHSISKIVQKIPFDTLTYEVAADQGHYVDEFTVLHEMAIHIGKVLMSLLVVGVAFALPLQWTFLLAAIAAMGLSVMRAQQGDLHLMIRRVRMRAS